MKNDPSRWLLSGLLVLIFFSPAAASAAIPEQQLLDLAPNLSRNIERLSVLDRSRVLKGLFYLEKILTGKARNADLRKLAAPIENSADPLFRALRPAKDEDSLEAFANLIEISERLPPGLLRDEYAEWAKFYLDPHFIWPETTIGRLGLALIILNSLPGADGMKMADLLLEAAVDSVRLEDEWYHFDGTHRTEGLAHRLLQQILNAPVPSVHQRKLSWIFQTQQKYISRRLTDVKAADYEVGEALVGHGLTFHGLRAGEALAGIDPAANDRPLYFSVLAKSVWIRNRELPWLEKSQRLAAPRLYYSPGDFAKIARRNRTDGRYSAELKQVRKAGDEALAAAIPEFEPAPNLDLRGRTNALNSTRSGIVSRLRQAFVACGDPKYGEGFKRALFSEVSQYERYGAVRCYYNLNVPGPWDEQYAVHTFTDAYEVLAGGGLLTAEEKKRIILMLHEMGSDLEWTVRHSNLIVHNAWSRWTGALGMLANYWPDFPESPTWKALLEEILPRLYSGIAADGGWWENTTDYHCFAMDPLYNWFYAARKIGGGDLFYKNFNDRNLVMMLDWLVKLAPPGGQMPPFNDSEKFSLKNNRTVMNMARYLKRSDVFQAVLAQKSFPPIDRLGEADPGPKAPPYTSVLLEGSGFGVFRSGWNRDDFYCAVKFGPHGGGHGHFDKGEIYLQAFGHPWVIDPGYGLYGTAKHSTVVVDRMDQRPASGRLIDWHQGAGLDLISIEHQAYAFVTHRRTVFYPHGRFILLVDELTPLNRQSHTYDWLLQLDPLSGKAEGNRWELRHEKSSLRVFFPENDPDGRRNLGPFVNVNELPDNYSKMTNDNLYLKIWQGKWTKQSDRLTAFVALIDLSGGNGPEWQVRQTQDENGITVEAKQSGRAHVFGLRRDVSAATPVSIGRYQTDARYFYIAPDGKKTLIKGKILK